MATYIFTHGSMHTHTHRSMSASPCTHVRPCTGTLTSFSHRRLIADNRGWSGQAELDRCLPCTLVVIPKARRLLANNNTEVHSWPEISSPKHPRHVLASVSHPCGFHPPAASRRCSRRWRRQHRHLGQEPAMLPSTLRPPLQGPQACCGSVFPQRQPYRKERRSMFMLRSGLTYKLSFLQPSPSRLGKHTPHTASDTKHTGQGRVGQLGVPLLCGGISVPHFTPSPQPNDVIAMAAILQVRGLRVNEPPRLGSKRPRI